MNDDSHHNPETLDEYEFSAGTRGKYAERCPKGGNVVVLSPDVAKSFPDSDSVNRARCRALISVARDNVDTSK